MFIPVAIAQYVVLFAAMFEGLNNHIPTSYVSYVMILFSMVYIVFIIAMLIVMRRVRDAYYIKREYLG